MIVDYWRIRAYIEGALRQLFVPDELIGKFASGMVDASLFGVDTHGIRLFPTYVRELEGGRSKAAGSVNVNLTSASTARLDAANLPGILAGYRAAEVAAELARQSGAGCVTVHRSNHFGAAQIYAREIAKKDLVALVMTNAAPRVVPFNGSRQVFGTNPICFAAPHRGGIFCVDMATSQVSYSRIKAAVAANEELEPGWAVDFKGRPCVDPMEFESLLPLGGYKGQGLAMMVEVLCSILSGASVGIDMSHLDSEPYDEPRGVGHFVVALDPERFVGLCRFRSDLHCYLARVREAAEVGSDSIVLPGDIEDRNWRERIQTGIPINENEIRNFLSVEHLFSPPQSLRMIVECASGGVPER